MATKPFLAVCGHTNIDLQLHVKELPKAGTSVPVYSSAPFPDVQMKPSATRPASRAAAGPAPAM